MDANAVIDFFNGSLPASGQQMLSSLNPVISVITHIELFGSARTSPSELLQLE